MEVTLSGFIIAVVVFLFLVVVCRYVESVLRSPLISDITDKYVLVTGCDTGFGNLVTRQLDRRGVHVFAACLTAKGTKDVESKTSERVVTLLLDVTDHDSIVAAFEFVKSKLPKDRGLWGLVNNAGIFFCPGLLEWCTRQDYEKTLQINLIGVIDVTITFLPLLKKARGRVVNVASVLSRVALGTGGYSESKYGVQAFSDTLRRESITFDYGIKVSILEPGFFKTRINDPVSTRDNIKTGWNRLPEEKKKEFPPELHQELINDWMNTIMKFASPELTKVTDAMIHGILARWPKTRYQCGSDTYIFGPLSYAPTFVADWLFCRRNASQAPPMIESQWAQN